jgi:hypothetical protein
VEESGGETEGDGWRTFKTVIKIRKNGEKMRNWNREVFGGGERRTD